VAGVAGLAAEALARRLQEVRARIAAACARGGRDPQSVTLVAVSKQQPAEAVAAALTLGQREFGENYAQELRDKARAVPGARWHFIGALQRNKVRLVVGTASLIHTLDDIDLLQAIADRARRSGVTQDCLVQVNTGEEPQKAGVSTGALPDLLDAFAAEGGAVRCLGLMCLPPAPAEGDPPDMMRPHFRMLRGLSQTHRMRPRAHVDLRELSMGMSHDFAVAIEEGATLVRIGTAIFGPREHI
jgi:hypothetical protein